MMSDARARRVTQWTPEVAVGVRPDPRGAMPQHMITPALMDEAVEDILLEQGLDEDRAQVTRNLLAQDHTSSLAHAYYAGMSSMGLQQAHVRALRRELVIPYAMPDSQMALLTSYAAEYKLVSRPTEAHDHPLVAAYRLVDQMTVESRIPAGVDYSDIGGSTIRLASSGNVHGHVCRPFVDRKDPARMVIQNLALRKMASSDKVSDSTRLMADAILQRDPRYICGDLAQKCQHKSPVALSVHVYDIAIQEWPAIMESKGVVLVEGCMLFSNKLFDKSSGVFDAAGVRYTVDRANDTYSMGFVDSPAWWYRHSFTDYLRYGADQILYGKNATYSYKVVERRGDTIFFRIVPVASSARPTVNQVYKLPGVRMVRVRGYDTVRSGVEVGREVKEWHWPSPLWDDMVSRAAQQAERGVFTIEDMFNYYRSIAPRQTINAVLVSGGYSVEMDELVALVVHSGLAGMMSVIKTQLSTRAVVDGRMLQRARYDMPKYRVVFESLKALTYKGVSYACRRVAGLLHWFSLADAELDEVFVSEWEPDVEVRMLPARVVLGNKWTASVRWGSDYREHDFSESVRANAPLDLITAASKDPTAAAFVLDVFEGALPQDVVKTLLRERDKLEVADDQEHDDVGPRVGYAETVDSSVVSRSEKIAASRGSVIAARRAAIVEALTEVELEMRQVEASCAAAYAELMVQGEPSESLCRTRAEVYYNPDFWYVVGGVFKKSLLGRDVSSFEQSAVFVPVFAAGRASRLCPVQTEYYDARRGGDTSREHLQLTGSTFTGWVYTSDALAIYNGPEILESLRESLNRSLDFQVVLQQGPPGCGKTTSIVKSVEKDDVVLGAVRISVAETRGRVSDMRPALQFPVRTRVRTLDSYLVNCLRTSSVRKLKTGVVRADEVFMCHAGKWYAAFALLGCHTAYVYGDKYQIPHVPRASVSGMHVQIRADRMEETFITYRCPQDAVASWGDVYDWKVRSSSKVVKSMAQVTSAKGLPIPVGCVMMGMYQADKVEMERMYAGCGVPITIMSVHESQGNTYEHVRLHRFDSRRREKNDKTSLYDRQDYALVAMSRHTTSFVYVRLSTVADQVTRRVVQASDVRRVASAAELETAGQKQEYC